MTARFDSPSRPVLAWPRPPRRPHAGGQSRPRSRPGAGRRRRARRRAPGRARGARGDAHPGRLHRGHQHGRARWAARTPRACRPRRSSTLVGRDRLDQRCSTTPPGARSVNIRRKELDDRFYSALEFGVSRDGIQFREGALAGEKLKLFFNQLVRADLRRPRRSRSSRCRSRSSPPTSAPASASRSAAATSPRRCARSMSVPGLIAPVVREGRKLVDGGLTDNLPVAEVRSLCNRRRRDRGERGLAAAQARRGDRAW